jgi:CheY-like chemotaxis protein
MFGPVAYPERFMPSDSPAGRDSEIRPRRVLVVEDEALVRLLVVQILEEAGYEVCEAAEAKGALAQLQSGEFIDLMVTDVGLPGVNGKQLADQARGLRPDLKVLFMTGYADTGLLDAKLPHGVDLITKPFDLDELANKAGALLGL